ncbi:MAG: hypothetical protein HUJ26_24310 [Planctomycetaceae bacterium]|nr:hypothetical protein [Planctomycetaceae bacterium]
MINSLYHSRLLVLTGILVYWGMTLIDTYPHNSVLHEKMNEAVDPVLNRVNLWQGRWQLFAPDIDHWNMRIECVVTWDDGTESRWSTLDWNNATFWERMVHFRWNEYIDNVTGDQGPALWEPLSEHLVREMAKREGKTPHWAQLIYQGETLPPPNEAWRKAYSVPEFHNPDHFYSWYPHEFTESEIMLYGN